MGDKERLIIIDSHALIHRAYHALPPLRTKKGELINAVYGFLLVFLKAIREFQPDYIAACFDFPAPTFRHKKYKEYKITRPPTPEELCQQIPKVKEILGGFNVAIFEKKGFEADDVIGTIARLASKKVMPEIETIILSGDLDFLQLVDTRTKVYTLRKGVKDIILYDEDEVEKKYRLAPHQLLDFKALRGDPSDNIPGVTGVGEKTAVDLLSKFSSLENLYKEIEENSKKARTLPPKLKETLLKYKEQAFLSKDLAKIERNTPIDFNLKECQWRKYDKKKVKEILKELEFYSLLKKLPQTKGRDNKETMIENLRLW